MARELEMNPKKFGSIASNDQERWKAPLGEFIEGLYKKMEDGRANSFAAGQAVSGAFGPPDNWSGSPAVAHIRLDTPGGPC